MYATEINYNIRKEEVIYETEKSPTIIYNKNNLYYNILNEYIHYLNTKELEKSTIYSAKRNCIHFLNYIENYGIVKIIDINIKVIENYIQNIRNNLSVHTKKNILKNIKLLLKYLYIKEYITEDLSLNIPTIKVPNYNTVPSIMTDENIRKMFQTINRNTKHGKKVYAIFLLALRYGLRPCDIKNLKFENIYWKERKIKIIQHKTKVPLTLPLTEEISDALIDYIKNARIKSDEPYIFLTKNAQKYGLHNSFYNYYTQLLKKANIVLPKNHKKGIYSLRHTLASSLLKENIPLPIISSTLGHSSTMSTMNYLKIDLNQLKTCCLEIEDIYEKR